MIDYSALLYDPVYAALGVPATLTLHDTDGTEFEITVIDVTRRKSLMSGSAEVIDIGPAVFARIPELTAKGIACKDCRNAVLAFSGRSWIVRTAEKQGNANGEDAGEVLFALKADE